MVVKQQAVTPWEEAWPQGMEETLQAECSMSRPRRRFIQANL